MGISKTKLKKDLLQKSFERTEGKKREDDPRVLNYYDLKVDERMEIIFIADQHGELFTHFKKHGPYLDNAAVGSINCAHHSNGETCPACAHGYQLYKDGDETSKKWMAKDYYVAQCVVVDAPFEVPVNPTDNQAKIFYMPYAVMEKIKESYSEGLIEDPTEYVFVIKKTENKGKKASYANSYFQQKKIPDEVIEVFSADDVLVEPYDLVEEGIVPEPTTSDEVQEWLDKTLEVMSKGGNANQRADDGADDNNSASRRSSEDSSDDSKAENKSSVSSLRERLAARRSSSDE